MPRRAGVDGLIVVDLPPEEADLLVPHAQRAAASTSSAWSRRPPTTRACRIVLDGSSGFVYYVSVTGITGTRSATARASGRGDPAHPPAPPTCRSRSASASARPQQAAAAARVADAAVVGSALVDTLAGEPRRARPRRGRTRCAACSTRCARWPTACARRAEVPHELAHRIRPPEDPHAVRRAREVPENLWHKCPACEQMIFHRDLETNLQGLPALRPPHARRRRRALRLDVRRGHAARASSCRKVPARSAALPRQQALRRPAEGGAREDPARRRHRWSRTARSAASRAVVAVMEFAFMGGSMGAGGRRGASSPPRGSRCCRTRR